MGERNRKAGEKLRTSELTARRSTAARSANNELTESSALSTAGAESRRLHRKPRVLSLKKDPAKLPRNQEKSKGKRARYLADSLEWKEAEKGECIAFNAERRL